MFLTKPTPKELTDYCRNTLSSHLGIEFTEVGDDFLVARMPVDATTHQPLGILHGGANCVLAEQVGSMAANLALDRTKFVALGLDINANHLRGATNGYVYGKATAIHIGSKTHVWEIRITDDQGALTCISRLTMMVLQITPETMRKNIL